MQKAKRTLNEWLQAGTKSLHLFCLLKSCASSREFLRRSILLPVTAVHVWVSVQLSQCVCAVSSIAFIFAGPCTRRLQPPPSRTKAQETAAENWWTQQRTTEGNWPKVSAFFFFFRSSSWVSLMSVSIEVLCLSQQLSDIRREYAITSYYKTFLVDAFFYVSSPPPAASL